MDEKTCEQYRKTLDYFKTSNQIENRDYPVLENEIKHFNKLKTKKQVTNLILNDEKLLIFLVHRLTNFGPREQPDQIDGEGGQSKRTTPKNKRGSEEHKCKLS